MKIAANNITSEVNSLELISNDSIPNIQALVLKDQQGFDIIPYVDIIRCEANGNYTVVHLTNGHQITTCQTLKSIQSQLPNTLFIRIHQSHLVALASIRRIGCMRYVCLEDGSQIAYSRRSKQLLLKRLGIA